MPTSTRSRSRLVVASLAIVVAALTDTSRPYAQQALSVGTLSVTAEQAQELRTLAAELNGRERSGSLRMTTAVNDWLAAGHRHERLQQFHLGLPVVGGDLTRHTYGGVVTSVFGTLYRTDRSNLDARLGPGDVRQRMLQTPDASLIGQPTLKWLGAEDGSAVLVYEAFVAEGLKSRVLYVDADTGDERMSMSLVHMQSATGEGVGVLGDRKKVSAASSASGFRLDDQQRPPVLQTLDLRGSTARFDELVEKQGTVTPSDLAADADNNWTDPGAVDAHVYLGWTYDFLYKRLGFRGLNNANAPMRAAINLRSPSECLSPAVDIDDCVNAFWAGPPFGPEGRGVMFFGNGLPLNVYLGSSGQTVNRLAGAIDIVAHELTHGVTGYTSNLVYRNESGSLNEAFSDMLGTAVEAYYQPRGPQYQGADYLMGEDVFRAVQPGAKDGNRSMASPSSYGDPDHYSLRENIGSAYFDNGGVHSNSGIANHAYYLAIEGGTHRLSGRSVTGVGFANRDQIEKTFFRALTMMLPSGATFFQARTAIIQSARDLYGAGGAVERAVTQAWDAVGVSSPGAALTTRFTPNPVPASSLACGGGRPSFTMTVAVSEFQNVGFNITGFDANTFDTSGRLLSAETFSAQTFATWFTDCGAGSTQIRAGGRACARLCTALGGRSAGVSVFRFRGTDVNGNVGIFMSDPVGLGVAIGATVDETNTTFGPPTITKIP